jgi:hypothetical protein
MIVVLTLDSSQAAGKAEAPLLADLRNDFQATAS